MAVVLAAVAAVSTAVAQAVARRGRRDAGVVVPTAVLSPAVHVLMVVAHLGAEEGALGAHVGR
jgi:hypothetical protein